MNINSFKDKLRTALLNNQDSVQTFYREIENKDVVIFLGNTRSGKSTLINYFIGVELEAFKERRNVYKIHKVNESANGPCIGQGSLSSTIVPRVYSLKNIKNMVIIDMPGFGDNRGEIQETINSIYINQIKHARMCKFVLVVDINDFIHDNVAAFTSLFKQVNELIFNFKSLIGVATLIITKECSDFTRNEIVKILKDQICNLKINPQQLEVLNWFIKHEQFIGLFRMPFEEGKLPKNIDDNIKTAILSTAFLQMHRNLVGIPLGNSARIMLSEIQDDISDNLSFYESLRVVVSDINEYFEIEDYVFASYDEELDYLKTVVEKLIRRINNVKLLPLCHIKDILRQLETLDCISESQNLYKTMNLFILLEDVLLVQNSFKIRLIQKYKTALSEILHNLTELTNKIDNEQTIRQDLTLNFTRSVTNGAASAGITTVGAVALNTLRMGTLATGVAGMFTGIGALCALGYAVRSINLSNEAYEALENRRQTRILQGRELNIQ